MPRGGFLAPPPPTGRQSKYKPAPLPNFAPPSRRMLVPRQSTFLYNFHENGGHFAGGSKKIYGKRSKIRRVTKIGGAGALFRRALILKNKIQPPPRRKKSPLSAKSRTLPVESLSPARGVTPLLDSPNFRLIVGRTFGKSFLRIFIDCDTKYRLRSYDF